MEQNLPIIAKKFWNIVRVFYFMLRKGISKAKLLADLNVMMKRGKIAGKAAIHNLMFHHAAAVSASARRPINEYEFSCGNSPAFFQFPSFHLSGKRSNKHAPPIDADLLAAALDMINSAAASPALPGFGPSPMVRQLRITDSPFPLCNVDEDNHVDEAAEKFIMKFYNDLKRQNSKSPFS
ncbi:uncharacterized protein LOC130992494 [Salvia miltiorrhiza]|uniref:uncharacterized protein LOC130992494 n=1 Tax=Salvia miltiorrhiza TaxID=226208 RepID=UPI0025ACB900|nr:uncharacterized protein LOC130992494 [Salvia miltiorrhiza]